MDHIFKTIDELDFKIAEYDDAAADLIAKANKLRSTVNDLCSIAGIQPKYNIDETLPMAGAIASTPRLSIKADEFYGKPLASAVKGALNHLRAINRAPASIEAIYDVLLSGGFEFPTKAKDAAIQGLSVSIGKNSKDFVKMRSGLIAVKDWYGTQPRRTRAAKDTSSEANGESQEATLTDEDILVVVSDDPIEIQSKSEGDGA